MDYLIFYHALTYLVLAMVAWMISDRISGPVRWKFLSLFGISMMLSQLLSYPMVGEAGLYVRWSQLALRVAGYWGLIVFGLKGASPGGLKAGRWQGLVLTVPALSGGYYGLAGLQFTVVLVLGATGTYWGARALLSYRKSLNRRARTIKMSVILLCLNGLSDVLLATCQTFKQLLGTWANEWWDAGEVVFHMVGAIALTGFTMTLWRHYVNRRRAELSDIRIFHQSIRGRWLVATLGVVLLTGWLGTEMVGRYAEELHRKSLLEQVNTIATAVDPGLFSKLTATTNDYANPEYVKFRKQCILLGNVSTDIRYIYTMGIRGREIFFYSDSEPDRYSQDKSAAAKPTAVPGEIYADAPAELRTVFATGAGQIMGPYTDKWGTFISAMAPIGKSGSRDPVAVMGMDVVTTQWRAELARIRLIPMVCVFLCSFLLVSMLLTGQRDHEAKTALAIAMAERQSVLDAASEVAIISTTPSGVIAVFNKGAENMLGYLASEVIGRHTPELFHEPSQLARRAEELSGQMGKPVSTYEGLIAMAREHGHERREWTYIHRDKHPIQVDLTVTPVRSLSGEIRGYLGIAQDVSARKLLEERLRQAMKMEAVGQLAGGVAHDFNNVLTVIQGNLSLLFKNPGISGEMESSLQDIKAMADRAASLTRQLLTFSRQQPYNNILLDFNALLGNIRKMLLRILGEHIKLVFEYTAEEIWIQADVTMMEQIVLNLAVNARDAMPRGGTLTIKTCIVRLDENESHRHAEGRPGDFLHLSFADTGCGMNANTLSHIFEPFFTTKEVGKGTGLGLATVFGIVQQHKGWIEVASEEGKGSAFHIYLPRCPRPLLEQKPAHKAPIAKTGRETLLVVEDEASLRALVVLWLKRHGYTILEADSGVEALKVWEKNLHHVDMVITDMVMPDGLSGKDLADRIKKDKPHIKILFTSGYSEEMVCEGLQLVPGENYLPKPYEPHMLTDVVRKQLDVRA